MRLELLLTTLSEATFVTAAPSKHDLAFSANCRSLNCRGAKFCPLNCRALNCLPANIDISGRSHLHNAPLNRHIIIFKRDGIVLYTSHGISLPINLLHDVRSGLVAVVSPIYSMKCSTSVRWTGVRPSLGNTCPLKQEEEMNRIWKSKQIMVQIIM